MSKVKKEPLYKFIKNGGYVYGGRRGLYKVILGIGILISALISLLPTDDMLKWALLGFPLLAFISWFLLAPLKMENYLIPYLISNSILMSVTGVLSLTLTLVATFPLLPLNEWLLAVTAILFYMSPFFYYLRTDYEKTKEYMLKVHRGEIEPTIYKDEDGTESISDSPQSLMPPSKFYIVETPMWVTMAFNINIFLMVAFSMGIYIVNKLNPVHLDSTTAWMVLFFNVTISMFPILITIPVYGEFKPLLHAVKILKDEEFKVKGNQD